MRHLEPAADDSGEKVFEGRLDRWRDHFFRSELAGHVDVAEAARRDPSVVELLPVMEAVPTVMGAIEQALRDRFRRDHLTTGRHDECLEVTEQTAGIAVGRDEDSARLQVGERFDATILDELGTGFRGP